MSGNIFRSMRLIIRYWAKQLMKNARGQGGTEKGKEPDRRVIKVTVEYALGTGLQRKENMLTNVLSNSKYTRRAMHESLYPSKEMIPIGDCYLNNQTNPLT